jgi:uncharacterized protein (DUF362 family)
MGKDLEYSANITTISNLKKDLKESLEFIEWEKFVKKNSKVFVKPNFTFPYHQEGITTTPYLLKNLLEVLKERTDHIIVGESNGGNHTFTADEGFSGHGMYKICEELDVKLVNLSKLPSQFVEDTIQGKKVKVQVPNMLLEEIDCFISVPVLKVHVMTGVTLGMKNLWGCYPDTMRGMHHQHLDYKLTLLNKILNPKIVVIDGISALDGHGPMYGEPVNMNLLITANNVVASDMLGAHIMGMPPKKINHFNIAGMQSKRANHVAVAAEEGLGPKGLDEVRMNQDWRQFQRDFKFNKTLMDKLLILPFNSRLISKIIYDSVFRRAIIKIADRTIKNKDELAMDETLEKYWRK